MAPCTIRTLQVQPHSTPASHAERERKGFIRAVWVLTRISNVISVIWSGPRCTEDGDRSCDAPSVAQGWRCMAAQCDKESAISHIRTLWPLLFLLRASHNIRYSNQTSYITLLDEFLPAPGVHHRLSVRADTSEGCPLWSHLSRWPLMLPHTAEDQLGSCNYSNKSVFVKQTYFLIPEMDLSYGRGFYVLPERDISHSFCFLFHFLKL